MAMYDSVFHGTLLTLSDLVRCCSLRGVSWLYYFHLALYLTAPI